MTGLVRRGSRVCPWWFIRSFDNPLRRFVQNPDTILRGIVRGGDRALDLGCGYGYFTIPMARLAGASGSVTAADVQPQMLAGVERRAKQEGLATRIRLHRVDEAGLDFAEAFDVVLAFWMLHEVPDQRATLEQIHGALKPGGRLLLVEPKGHVSRASFAGAVELARQAGLTAVCAPDVGLSRAVLMTRADGEPAAAMGASACADVPAARSRRTRHRTVPFSVNRRMAAASAAVCRGRDTIHTLTEVDITEPRRLIREHHERTGERLSLTAYVVTCMGRAIAEQPSLNVVRRGRKLYLLNGVTVGTLVERSIDGEFVPEPFGIRAADAKTYRQVNDELRAAQRQSDGRLGGLSGATWVRFVPSVLFRTMIRAASGSVRMAERYGVVSVTAVGMFGKGPMWLVPLSASTVAVAVGAIVARPVMVDGRLATHEHLCLTISFDHDIVDGAPAARFTARFSELIAGGAALREAAGGAAYA